MHGWDVRPTLDRASATGRSLAQAAGSLVAGSPLPQALIQCRQRLTDELRLGTLVILSWSAPQPVADDSAVAQPTTASSLGSSAPRTDRGHAATPHPAPDVTSRKSLRAEQRGCMPPPPRTWLARPSGAVILLITGAISLLGPKVGLEPTWVLPHRILSPANSSFQTLSPQRLTIIADRLYRIRLPDSPPAQGARAMGRKASVRQKNGYWFSEAGGVGRYFGRVAQVSYSEAMARLWAALAGCGDRGGFAGNDGDDGTIVQPSANEPFSPVGSHTAPEFVRSQSGAAPSTPTPQNLSTTMQESTVAELMERFLTWLGRHRSDRTSRSGGGISDAYGGLRATFDCRMAPGDVPG